MANNLPALKTALASAFTTNLDAATVTNLVNAFVLAYNSQWLVWLTTNSLTDTPGNRGKFAAQKAFDYFQDIYTAGQKAAQLAGLPPVTPIQ